MTEKNKSQGHGKRLSVFYIIYFACLILFFLALAAVLKVVRDRLAEYEAVQPKYMAQEIFSQYFEPVDYTALLRDARYDAKDVEFDRLVEYLTEEIGSETLTCSAGSSNAPDQVRYIVKAGRKQIAAINLSVSDRTTEHGFKTYDFSYMELLMTAPEKKEAEYTVTINVPSGYTVLVDGILLTKEAVSEEYINHNAFRHFPTGIEGIAYTAYTLSGLTALPEEVTVTDAEGRESLVSFDEEAMIYTAEVIYSDALAQEYGDFVTEAVEGYAAYMQNVPESGFSKIRKYFDADSQLYKAIQAAGRDLWMVRTPTGNDFEDVEVGEFYALSEDVISCHIAFTQLLHRDNKSTPDVIDMYVFLHKTADGYKIYEWYNNS